MKTPPASLARTSALIRIKKLGLVLLALLFGLVTRMPAAGEQLPEKLVIATWNLEWFFDHDTGDNYSELAKRLSAPSQDNWRWKVTTAAAVIAEIQPDILALQEVENRRVLTDLVEALEIRNGLTYRVAFVEGGDTFTEQDVAILYRGGLVGYGRREQTREMFNSNQYFNVQKHLFAEFQWEHGEQPYKLTLLTAHLRARAERDDIRRRQCNLLHHWVRDEVTRGGNVIVLGDLNTEVAAEDAAAANDLGTARGLHTRSQDDDLFDAHLRLPARERSTHINDRQYDRILLSPSLVGDKPGLKLDHVRRVTAGVIRGAGPDGQAHFDDYYGVPDDERDVSDHYPVVVELRRRK
jgi:endonuclease/exonuclease/phosphatase family metal-dependent hydrolase